MRFMTVSIPYGRIGDGRYHCHPLHTVYLRNSGAVRAATRAQKRQAAARLQRGARIEVRSAKSSVISVRETGRANRWPEVLLFLHHHPHHHHHLLPSCPSSHSHPSYTFTPFTPSHLALPLPFRRPPSSPLLSLFRSLRSPRIAALFHLRPTAAVLRSFVPHLLLLLIILLWYCLRRAPPPEWTENRESVRVVVVES